MKFETELLKRIPQYRKDGVLDKNNADRLEQHARLCAKNTPYIFIDALYGIGAIMLCFALVLLVAYNWDELSRSVRIFFSFVPLIASLAFGAFALGQKRGAIWREAAALLNITAVACMLSLISQIFQINGDIGAFSLTCCVLTIPAIYIFRSSLGLIALCIFATIYSCKYEWNGIYVQSPYITLALFAVMLPFCVYQYKERKILKNLAMFAWCAMFAISVAICTGISEYFANEYASFVLFFGIGSILCLASQMRYFNSAPKLPVLIFGFIVFIIASTMLNYGFPTWELSHIKMFAALFKMPIFAATCLLWIAALICALANKERNAAVVVISLIFPISVLAYWGYLPDKTYIMLASNLVMFGAGFTMFLIGFRRQSAAVMNIGVCIIIYLAALKFFSDDFSMLLRASMLGGAGAFLIISNFILNKVRRLNEN